MAKELNPNLVSLFRLFIVWLFLFVSFQFGILSRALLERNHLKFELLIPHESSSEIDPISFQNANQIIFKTFNFECYCIAILDPFCFTYSHLIIDYSNYRRMSVTVSNWRSICDAPTNRSPAKMSYSFSRSNRFKQQPQNKYNQLHSDPKFSTISPPKIKEELPVSAMAINTTSQKSTSFLTQSTRQPSSQLLLNPHRFWNQRVQGFLLRRGKRINDKNWSLRRNYQQQEPRPRKLWTHEKSR